MGRGLRVRLGLGVRLGVGFFGDLGLLVAVRVSMGALLLMIFCGLGGDVSGQVRDQGSGQEAGQMAGQMAGQLAGQTDAWLPATDAVEFSGYLQGSLFRIRSTYPEPLGQKRWMEARVLYRARLSWDITPNLSLQSESRTRLFAGDLVNELPGYASAADDDPGWVDLSTVWTEHPRWFLISDIDRLYGEWDRGGWNVRVGRQRVNWGMGQISQPHDLFNLYSFYDLDYPERPGSDAVRVRRFVGEQSRVEVAFRPGVKRDDAVAAMLVGTTWRHTDWQLIAGVYRKRLAMGLGWATDVRGIGLKGESMVFGKSGQREVPDLTDVTGSSDISEIPGKTDDSVNVVLALSAEYMFDSGLFWIAEFLYNKDGERDRFQVLGSLPAPDNPSFTRTQWTSVWSYPFTMVMSGALSAGWYPGEEAVYVSPSMSFSVSNRVDWQVAGQFFAGAEGSIFEDAGSVLFTALRWYY